VGYGFEKPFSPCNLGGGSQKSLEPPTRDRKAKLQYRNKCQNKQEMHRIVKLKILEPILDFLRPKSTAIRGDENQKKGGSERSSIERKPPKKQTKPDY